MRNNAKGIGRSKIKPHEGIRAGAWGNSGYKSPGEHYPPHLHIDAADKEGNMVDPLTRNYGTISNEEFFNKYDGDYTKIPGYTGGSTPPPFDSSLQGAP